MKKVLFFVLAAAVMMGFVGCNDDKKVNKTPRPTEITVTALGQNYDLGYYVATNKTGLPTNFIYFIATVKDKVSGQVIANPEVQWIFYSGGGNGHFYPNPSTETLYNPVLDSAPMTVITIARYMGSSKYEGCETWIDIKQNY